MIELDLTPDVTIVQSMRAEARMNLTEANAELVDNSLDWGATEIRIDVSREEIRISDNGKGCADFQRMLKLGTHNPDGRRIGRYGVGFNTAAIWLGRSVEVESVCYGKRRRVKLCWDDIQPGWKVAGPDPENTPDPTGLNIRIFDLIPRRHHIADLAGKLRARYPFLELSGKAIWVNGARIPGIALPQLDRQITGVGEWEGRAYRLTAGVVHRPALPWQPGFTVMLRDRVLADGVSHGCGNYSLNGFFGLVELLEGVELDDRTIGAAWPVDKIKSGITDTIRWFLESLLPTVEPLLKVAESESSNLTLRGLEQQLSGSWLEQALFGAREKRPGGGSNAGTVEPADTGRKRQRATDFDANSPGSVRIARGVGRAVKVKFALLGDERDIAGVNHNSERTECILNEAHPFVRANRDLGLMQTKMLIAQMVVTHWLDDGSNERSRIVNQLSLPLDGPRFGELQRAMARVLRHLSVEEGER